LGWVEAKDVGKSLDEAERTDQLKRYLKLPNLVLTDFLEFRWFTDGQPRATAHLGRLTPDGKVPADIRASVLGLLGTVSGLAALAASSVAGVLWSTLAPWASFGYGALGAVLGAVLLARLPGPARPGARGPLAQP
jgi:hypothetical protein